MKKAFIIIICVLILLPTLAAGTCYGVIWYQYRDTYMPGIFINSTYSANLTPEQMNNKLTEKIEYPELVIKDIDGGEHTLSLSEIGYQADYLNELQKIQKSQTVVQFVKWFLQAEDAFDEYEIEPETTYDKKKLEEYLDKESYLKDNSDPKNKIVEVRKNFNGYYLYDETKNLLKHDAAVKAIEDSLDNDCYELDLVEKDCYVNVDCTSKMKKSYELWEKLTKYLDSCITYKFNPASVVIDKKKISDFIAVDENGDFLFDENDNVYLDDTLIKDYIHDLAETHNTVGKTRRFKSTRGDMITIDKGTYGCKIDEKKEFEFLKNAIENGNVQDHEPIYSQKSYTNICGLDDIGNTYIEVDMSEQTLYYYKNGKQLLTAPVVTGNTTKGHGTPQRVCYVYYKQRNRTLRGEDYNSFVSYWMAVYGNIGIHDASWRHGRFGGNIYRTNGSHGCINTPLQEVSELYDMVDVGTPVVIFY